MAEKPRRPQETNPMNLEDIDMADLMRHKGYGQITARKGAEEAPKTQSFIQNIKDLFKR
jgi:hypothetical protein